MINRLLSSPASRMQKRGRKSSGKEEGYVDKFLERTGRILHPGAVRQVRDAHILIAGCGGVGGAVALTMARMGVEAFTLADPGVFDEPDVNRQWGADSSTLGRNKADVYRERLQAINPNIRATIHRAGITRDNVDALVASTGLVVDCLDISVPLSLRARLFSRARTCGSFAVTAPVLGFGALVAIASPDGPSMEPILECLEAVGKTNRMPEAFHQFYSRSCIEAIERDMASGKVPSLSIGPALAGALVCTEILMILTKGQAKLWRKPVCLPHVLMMDSLSAQFRVAVLSDVLGNAERAMAIGAQ